MDIRDANTEPFFRYYRFHEEFNRHIKVVTGALGLVLRESASTTGTNIRLPTDGEPWGTHTEWKRPSTVVPPAKCFISQLGVVRVLSAFEDFTVGLESEHSRYKNLMTAPQRGTSPQQTSLEGEKIEAAYRRLGWDIEDINELLPLLTYFVIVRNCIAHRSGRASDELLQCAKGEKLKHSLSQWEASTRKPPPKLPTIEVGETIPLLPRHAVLASAVCYRIAFDSNNKLREFLGIRGFVYMAAHHAILADDRIGYNLAKTVRAAVNFALTDRYHVVVDDAHESIAHLKAINRWEACATAFRRG